MKELYDITATEAINIVIDSVRDHRSDLSKAQCRKLVINSLVYNTVIEEIKGQIALLLDEYDEEGYTL